MSKKHKINKEIKAKELLLVGDNVERGIYSLDYCLKMANDLGLDLVEISPKSNPPVVKILDYQKLLFNQKKKCKKQSKVVTKEIRFKPFVDDNDFQRKTKQVYDFLKKGHKVKIDCLFVGRSSEFKKDAILTLTYTLLDKVSEVGLPEQMPKIQGNKMVCLIKPKKS